MCRKDFYNFYDFTLFLQLLVCNISHYSLIVRLKLHQLELEINSFTHPPMSPPLFHIKYSGLKYKLSQICYPNANIIRRNVKSTFMSNPEGQ